MGKKTNTISSNKIETHSLTIDSIPNITLCISCALFCMEVNVLQVLRKTTYEVCQ